MSTRESYSELKVDRTPLRVTAVTNYDPFEAKFCSSLYWLVFRATEDGGLDDIPPQVTSPIDRDAENRITVRPEVIELLTNDEIYGKVCNSIFDNKDPVVGHWAVIQCLSQHGFYVVEEGDIAVTDSTLQQRKPFRKSTHLALMDALMAAYSSKVVTIQQVVQAIRKFAPFNASKELPFDLEDSLLLWINKVCTTLNDNEIKKQKLHAEDLLRDQDKAKRFRFRRDQLQPKIQLLFPVIDDLLKGVSDGQCLLGLVIFYYPDAIKVEDIHFGQDISQEKIVGNIELFRSLCSQHISTTALSLQVEDLMYSSQAMKPNLIALLAEMFYKCEVEEDKDVEDINLRSKSSTDSENIGAGIKDAAKKNLENHRSSSAPMLASEIIAARCPAVGKKLMDFTKEKNKQRSSMSTPPEERKNPEQDKSPKRTSGDKRNEQSKTKQNRSYSLQLDFTDDEERMLGGKGGLDEEDPFNSIMRKPVLASRKYSAPDRVGNSPRMPPKPEPRLNKRAKQKPRTLALEDWEMEEKDTADIHLAELQRSQSLTGLDKTGMEPRRSFNAWQEGSSSDTDLDMKRSQRISLDFRPNQHLKSSQAHERMGGKTGLQTTSKYNEDRGSQDSVKSTDSLTNKPSSLPARIDGFFQENSQSCTSSMSERELKEFEAMEAMVLAQRSSEFNKYAAAKNPNVSEEDVLNASVSSDDMNRFRLEVLHRLTEDKIKNIEKQGNSELHQAAMHAVNKRVESGDNRQHSSLDPNGDISEELLSPINETSEPILSLPDTRASTPSTTPSSPCSPLEVAPFMPAFFMTSPANTIDKKAYKKAMAAKNKQEVQERVKEALGTEGIEPSLSQTPRLESLMRSKEDMTPRNKSLEALARGSYTVDKMSVDAAKAAGIPVIGNERVSELTLSAAYRTTTRSLSVPEPLPDDLNTPIHDRVSISNSHLVEQGRDGQFPHQLCNVDSQSKNPIGSNAISYGDPRLQGHEDLRQFSPRPSEDVVIFDRKTSDLFQGSGSHGSQQAMVPNNIRQPYVDSNQRYDVSIGLPDDRLANQHSSYQEQFVAAVSNRLINQGQVNDEIDASHVRASQNQDPSRTSFVSNTGTYIRNSPRDSRNSFVSAVHTDPRNSFIGQSMSCRNSFVPTPSESIRNSFVSNPGADIRSSMVGPDGRNSFIGNQGTDFRHSFVGSAGVETIRNSAYIAHNSADPGLGSRPVYSDQYGTYVKGAYPQDTPQGYHRDVVHDQGMDNEYSSPRQPHERHSSPGQFATFRKQPGPPVIQRQPSPGYHYEQHIPINHNTAPYSTSQVTSAMPIGQQGELQYSSSPRSRNEQNYRIPTSQPYPTPGHAQTDPRLQSPIVFHQNGSSMYRTQEYRPSSQQEVVDTYRGSISESNFDPRITQIQENTLQSVPQSPRTQANETTRTQSPRVQNGVKQPRDLEDPRVGSPDRKSKAFTVDLDTGELKEMSTSSDSMSPRSPGSTILRSKTFKKGPEERVFDYDTKQTTGQQNQGKVSPQASESKPAVISRKDNAPHGIGTTNSTSWSQSAEALMSVLHNGFPTENKFKNEDRVLSSPRRRAKSGSSDSPAPRINWMTAGLSGCGGQVMLNEKGEIEENKQAEEDTATAKHLTFLRLHFDEKRRQIEAEKRRNQEQWEDERRKLGETLFWYSIGRAQGSNNEPGPVRPGQEGAMRMKEPLRVITHPPRVTDYDGPTSSGQPTPPIGISTPLESMSPVTTYPIQSKPSSGYHSPNVEGYQSPRDPGHYIPPSFGHGYHQAPLQRPGYQSPAATASPTYQSPMYSQANYQAQTSSQAGYHHPITAHPGSQSPIASRTGYQSPVTSAGFQFPISNEGRPLSANSTGYHGNTQVQGYQAESGVRPNLPVDQEQKYETREFRLSEYPTQTTTPSKQHPQNNGPSKSPSRRCWEVNSPTLPPGFQPSFGGTDHDVQPQNDNGAYEDEDPTSKKAFSMFIGDEPEKTKKEGLTPEQQKKRDRFLRNRQKKMEEEKARRESENEKKRQREQKQRELEIQKRLEEEERRSETQRRSKQSTARQPRENGHNKPVHGPNQPEDHSAFAEFSGPQCYVKPSGKSNRKLIINAISHVCLSGTVNNESKERCLQAIAESQGFHFMVLFKDGLKFRGLYMHNPENEQSYKIYGIGPKVISSKMVDCVYKYSSGSKEFIKIPSKTLSISVDGVAINKVYWQSSKPNVASKTQSNLKRPPIPPQR